MEHEDRRIPNPISSSSAPRKFLLEHRHSSSRRTRRKRRAAIFEETLLPSPTERRKRKTGWKGKREKDPGILWTGFSDLCLRPRLLFVFLLLAARRDRGGDGKGTDETTRTESVLPSLQQTPRYTYVRGVPLHADISRKSHAGGKKKLSPPSFLPTTFVLPLPRIISSLYPPFRIGQTVHTHHFYSRVRPAFSFQPAISQANSRGPEEGRGERGISLTIDLVGREVRFLGTSVFNRRLIENLLANRGKCLWIWIFFLLEGDG